MLIFPGDDWYEHDQHWLLWYKGTPVGFCTADLVDGGSAVFLSRAGILGPFQERGLQCRMIRVRERWAKEKGASDIITYTLYSNHKSIASLLKMGYKFYTPEWKFAGDVHYFIKHILS